MRFSSGMPGSDIIPFPSSISEKMVLQALMDHDGDSVYFKDKSSRYIYINKILAASTDAADPSDMIGKTDHDFFPEAIADKSDEIEEMVMESGKPVTGHVEKVDRPDASSAWFSISKFPLFDQDGEIAGTWGITRDITEIEAVKEKLSVNEVKHRTMIENISDIIQIVDIAGIVKYISPNVKKEFGWHASELAGKSGFEYIHPDDRMRVMQKYEDLVSEPESVGSAECRILCKDGNYRYIEMRGKNMLSNPLIEGFLLNYHDITERKKQEAEIRYLSYHDNMTDLFNRSFFDEEKKRLDTARQLPLSIIIGDVNGLKLTNDAFGHAEGDRLLIEVARILRKCCRLEEIIARTGGDEFCILLPQTSSENAKVICNRIYKTCKQTKIQFGSRTFNPSISLGHATKTEAGQPIDQIMKNAEDYMYRRKLLERDTTHGAIINSIQAAMHETSNETEEHSDRMIKLSLDLGAALNLSDEQLLELDLLSRLHDIGKICIDEKILTKPGRLTDEEWARVKQHPEVGYRIAQASAELVRISHLILSHHERWDGNGYPQGLSGSNIPYLSRIISVIDSYDAMTQDRPYRKALPKNTAINEIINNASKQFDPKIARIFVEKVLKEPWELH
jgi:diguanylate cyclase (GGDEF)-like protein/PAS domain S-box-containing protein